MALEESYLTSSIPKRIIVSDCHFLKEIDQFFIEDYLRGNYKHIPQIVWISECCTFYHVNFSNSKYSDHTMLYFYVICNMLEPADLHETILTSIICQ